MAEVAAGSDAQTLHAGAASGSQSARQLNSSQSQSDLDPISSMSRAPARKQHKSARRFIDDAAAGERGKPQSLYILLTIHAPL